MRFTSRDRRIVWRPGDAAAAVPADASTADQPIPDTNLFQTDPEFSKPSLFRPKGWTGTVAGYIHEASKLKTCLLLNERLSAQPYTWHVTVAFEAVLSPTEIKATWAKVCRKLKRDGVIAVWVMEVNSQNHVHFHLVLRNPISRVALERTVETAMPARDVIGWHKCLQRINPDRTWQLAHYVTKAKVAGYLDGRPVADYYASKRRLFKPRLGLHKTGFIGGFWVNPKAAIWRTVVEREKQIAEGLERPHIRQLAEHVYEMLGGTVPLARIERSFGFRADSEPVRRWVARLVAGEDGYESAHGQVLRPVSTVAGRETAPEPTRILGTARKHTTRTGDGN